jgi:hypothetical protein
MNSDDWACGSDAKALRRCVQCLSSQGMEKVYDSALSWHRKYQVFGSDALNDSVGQR